MSGPSDRHGGTAPAGEATAPAGEASEPTVPGAGDGTRGPPLDGGRPGARRAEPHGAQQQPRGSGSPAEVDLRPLDPRVRLLWWTTASIAVVAAMGVAIALDLGGLASWSRGLLTAVTAAVSVPLAIGVPLVRYARWRYALRVQDLWIRRGIVFVTTTVIPYERLQFVDTRQGPLERLLGLAQLVVYTASPGTSGQLVGLDQDVAEQLRERLGSVRGTAGGV